MDIGQPVREIVVKPATLPVPAALPSPTPTVPIELPLSA
jgi:hypothetical protein